MPLSITMVVGFITQAPAIGASMITTMTDTTTTLLFMLVASFGNNFRALIFLLYLLDVLVLDNYAIPCPGALLIAKFVRANTWVHTQ